LAGYLIRPGEVEAVEDKRRCSQRGQRSPPRHHADKIDEYLRYRNDIGNGIAQATLDFPAGLLCFP
jgi:hypothetical protein